MCTIYRILMSFTLKLFDIKGPYVLIFFRSDGISVPLGKPIDTKISNPHGYTLNYNEFIVYDVKQIRNEVSCESTI